MLKRLSSVVFTLFLVALGAQADTNTISGVLTKVEPGLLEVGSHLEDPETTSVALNADTTYRKWIMAKPWQQDTSAKFDSLEPGMRIRVDLDSDAPNTADTVWIVVVR